MLKERYCPRDQVGGTCWSARASSARTRSHRRFERIDRPPVRHQRRHERGHRHGLADQRYLPERQAPIDPTAPTRQDERPQRRYEVNLRGQRQQARGPTQPAPARTPHQPAQAEGGDPSRRAVGNGNVNARAAQQDPPRADGHPRYGRVHQHHRQDECGHHYDQHHATLYGGCGAVHSNFVPAMPATRQGPPSQHARRARFPGSPPWWVAADLRGVLRESGSAGQTRHPRRRGIFCCHGARGRYT